MTLEGCNFLPEYGKGFIYILRDPVTMENRYIGQTKRSLYRRLKEHLYPYRLFIKGRPATPLAKWITKLTSQGLVPEIILLEVVDLSDIDEKEIWYISDGRNKYNLLNISKGGKMEGRKKGDKLTESQRQGRRGSGNNAFFNYIGTWFNQLVVTGFVGIINGRSHWSCICDCGKSVIIEVHRIGQQKSCGCARKTRWDDDEKKKFSNYVNKNRKRLPNGSFIANEHITRPVQQAQERRLA